MLPIMRKVSCLFGVVLYISVVIWFIMISAKITFSILILLYYVIMIVLIFDFSPIVCLKKYRWLYCLWTWICYKFFLFVFRCMFRSSFCHHVKLLVIISHAWCEICLRIRMLYSDSVVVTNLRFTLMLKSGDTCVQCITDWIA